VEARAQAVADRPPVVAAIRPAPPAWLDGRSRSRWRRARSSRSAWSCRRSSTTRDGTPSRARDGGPRRLRDSPSRLRPVPEQAAARLLARGARLSPPGAERVGASRVGSGRRRRALRDVPPRCAALRGGSRHRRRCGAHDERRLRARGTYAQARHADDGRRGRDPLVLASRRPSRTAADVRGSPACTPRSAPACSRRASSGLVVAIPLVLRHAARRGWWGFRRLVRRSASA